MTGMMKAATVACVALSVATRLDAQLANASAAALGMGENFSAVARGYHAVAWNPAALGLSGNPEASGALATFRASGGLGPIGVGDLFGHFDGVVSHDVKTEWLAEITRAGGQDGVLGGDMTWGAVQRGRFALHVSSTARALNAISPGFAELMLLGYLDENGNPKNLDLSGSTVDVNAYTSLAVSFGMPVVRADGSRLAVGVTAKHTIGHVLATSEPSTGAVTADSAAFAFPIVYTPIVREGRSHQLTSGRGFGLDVAVAYEAGKLSLAAVAQNVFNSFAWKPGELLYRPAELVFSEHEGEARFEPEPFTSAPASLREKVAELQFYPSWTLGAALRSTPQLTLAADARIGRTTGMSTRAPVHAGAGAEYRPLAWLPLQLGAAYVRTSPDRDGVQLTGGIGVQRGGFTFSVSGARRHIGNRPENSLMVALVSHTFNGVSGH